MAINLYKTANIFALTIILSAASVSAQESESLLNFKFNHHSNFKNNQFVSLVDTDANISTFAGAQLNSDSSLLFSQYDATWTYPWEMKNFNFDLGVTLRHLSGSKSMANGLNEIRFQETLPLLHGSALFNLPLKGLTAGIEGSHLGSSNNQIFDYRAKVAYEWRKGFGMQGGWQHQQFNLEKNSVNNTDYELNGPFIDLYLHF